MWNLELFGATRIFDSEDNELRFKRSSSLLLLGFLAAQSKPIRREEIAIHIFPDATDQQKANSALRGALFELEKRLAVGAGSETVVLKKGDALLLNRKEFQCDLWAFRQKMDDAQTASDPKRCAVLLKEAVALYGEYFPTDKERDWLKDLRAGLEAEFFTGLSRLIALLAVEARLEEMLRYLELYQAHDPYNTDLLLQVEQTRFLLISGENARPLPSPILWNEQIKSKRERQKQFRTLMASLGQREDNDILLASEKRDFEDAVRWRIKNLPHEALQLAEEIACLSASLPTEDAAALSALSPWRFHECLEQLVRHRLIAQTAGGVEMNFRVKTAVLKTASGAFQEAYREKHARRFIATARQWLARSPLPSSERDQWAKTMLPHLCQALNWTIDHLPEQTENLPPLLSLVEDWLATCPSLPNLDCFTDRIYDRIRNMNVSQQFRFCVYIANKMCLLQYRDKINGPLDTAMRLLPEIESAGEDQQWANALISLGKSLHHAGGRSRESEQALRAALNWYEKRESAEVWGELGWIHFELSETFCASGRLNKSRECLENSLYFLKKAGAVSNEIGIPLMKIGSLELSFGSIDKAETLLNEALNCLEESFNPVAFFDTLAYLGAVKTKRGHFKLAKRLLDESQARLFDIKQCANGMRVTLFLGDNARAQCQYQEALGHYREALCFWREYQSPGWVVISLARLAELALETDCHDEAEAHAEAILTICRGNIGLSSRTCAFYIKGYSALKRGESQNAECFLRKANALHQFLGLPMNFLRERIAQFQG